MIIELATVAIVATVIAHPFYQIYSIKRKRKHGKNFERIQLMRRKRFSDWG